MYSLSVQDSNGSHVYSRNFTFSKSGDVGRLAQEFDEYLKTDPMFVKEKSGSRTRSQTRKTRSAAKAAVKSQQKFNEVVQSAVSDLPLSGMTLTKYGKGWLLTCDDDHPRYGQKYFYSAWWMPSQNAWFLKNEFYDKMVSLGASDSETFGVDEVNEVESGLGPYAGMKVCEYGRGYLMTCDEGHKLWGEKYLEDNQVWWMPSQGGWFLKKSMLESVMFFGATLVDHSCKSCKTSRKSRR